MRAECETRMTENFCGWRGVGVEAALAAGRAACGWTSIANRWSNGGTRWRGEPPPHTAFRTPVRFLRPDFFAAYARGARRRAKTRPARPSAPAATRAALPGSGTTVKAMRLFV